MAKPKLALIPAAQGDKLYSVLPSSGVGDFDFTRSGGATRINSQGLIETVASGVSRLNYPMIDGVVKGCPHHILEPQRSNKLPYSEDFSDASWTKFGSPTIDVTSIISPDGTLNGTKVTRGSNPTPLRKGTSPILNIEHTFSIYAKKGNYDKLSLDIGDEDAPTYTLTDEWQRFEVTSTPASNNHVDINVPSSTNGDYIYIWGAMLEEGSYPTSYIPTTSAAVTRSAETANNSGDASTFNDSEGVLMFETAKIGHNSNWMFLGINNNTNFNQWLSIFYSGSETNTVRFDIRVNSAFQMNYTYVLPNSKDFNKLLIKYKENDVKVYVNGFNIFTDLNISVFNDGDLTNLSTYRPVGITEPFSGLIKQIQYFDSALNDSELEKLTSWVSFTDMANGQLYSVE